MEINFLYRNLTEHEEKEFSQYVDSKKSAIQSLLTKFAPDAKFLQASIERFDKHSAYEVEFSLTLPTKILVAKETSHAITQSVDLAKDRLVAQIKKHIAHLRGSRLHRSIRKNAVPSQINIFEEISL